MNSYLQFAKEKLFHAISENEHLLKVKGIFFTKHGQCVELKTVRLVTDSNPIGRLAILIKMRRDWQSYRFKEKKKNQLPSLSIIDFAIIPLKKPNLVYRSEENKEERKTFNLLKKKRRKKNRQADALARRSRSIAGWNACLGAERPGFEISYSSLRRARVCFLSGQNLPTSAL